MTLNSTSKNESPAIDRRRPAALSIEQAQHEWETAINPVRDVIFSKTETQQRALSEALRQATEAVLVLDADACISYLNPAFYRLFGYVPEDIIGQSIAALSVPEREDNLQPSEVIRQLNENGFCRDEVWRRAKDGTAIPVQLSTAVIRDATGDIAGYVGNYLNLRESESRLRVVVESVQAGIIVIDPDTHKIADVNSIAASMIGAAKEEIVGSVCHTFIGPAENGKCPITDLHQTVNHSECVVPTATGTKRPVIKSVTTVLLNGKEHLLESFIDITERKRMEEQLSASLAEKQVLVQFLHALAARDSLTKLYNRRAFYTLLDDELVRARRFDRPVSLLLLDIDHFKRVTGGYGHLAGDAVLKGLAKLLIREARAFDRVCRYGGEEVTVILPESDLKAAVNVAERMLAVVRTQPFGIDAGVPLRITVSIGVASFPTHADNARALVAAAESAMHAANQGGRNRVIHKEGASGEPTAQEFRAL